MGFLSAWRLYVVGAIVLAFIGAIGYGRYQYQRAEASDARMVLAIKQRDDLAGQLIQAEADKAALAKATEDLDAAIVARDQRAKELQHEIGKFKAELDSLKTTLPKEDQDCFDRPLPTSVLALLRDDGTDNSHPNPETASTGSPPAQSASPVPSQ